MYRWTVFNQSLDLGWIDQEHTRPLFILWPWGKGSHQQISPPAAAALLTAENRPDICCWYVILIDTCDNAFCGCEGPFWTEQAMKDYVKKEKLGVDNYELVEVPGQKESA